MLQALENLRLHTSQILLALEVLLFLVGSMTLATGRLVVFPRRYVDGIHARLSGFALMMPLVTAFLALFGLALWAHLTYLKLDYQAWRLWIELVQGALILLGLVFTALAVSHGIQMEQLA